MATKITSFLGVAAIMAALAASVAAQRVTDGLVVLYDFTEGQGSQVLDKGPALGVPGDAVDLFFDPVELSSAPIAGQGGNRPGLISWGDTWLNVNKDHPPDDGTAHGTPDAAVVWSGEPGNAAKIAEMVAETGQLTVEAWVRPETIENRSNSGRIVWMTVEGTADDSNFVIGQESCCDGPALPGGIQVRLNTDVAGSANRAELNSDANLFDDGDLIHVVHTHDTETEETLVYLNVEGLPFDDVPIIEDFVPGADFSGWDPDYVLALANDPYRFSRWFGGEFHLIAIYNQALSTAEIQQHFEAGPDAGGPASPRLWAGDADQDLDFDQLDLVKVQIAAKYLSGQAATWGEGDWDGAPGGQQGSPPIGNGQFDQLDIIAALAPGHYLTGSYATLLPEGARDDGQTSIIYNASTGELAVDAPTGAELTSINIDSAAGIFTGDAAQNLGGSFDNDADNNIFKATFGGSFGALSFGNVAQAGLSRELLLGDLTVVGSLAGGGDLGSVDLIYVPEPGSAWLLAGALALIGGLTRRRQAAHR
jgi:hypothetical protein